MPLDKIPYINWSVLETHHHDRFSSEEDFERFKAEIDLFMARNRPLRSMIELIARDSKDSNSVYHAAYVLLDLINAQLEVNELEEMSEQTYQGKK